jgi:hypothetical protein
MVCALCSNKFDRLESNVTSKLAIDGKLFCSTGCAKKYQKGLKMAYRKAPSRNRVNEKGVPTNTIQSGIMIGMYKGKEKPMSYYNSQPSAQEYLNSMYLEPIEGLKDEYNVSDHDRQIIGMDKPFKN